MLRNILATRVIKQDGEAVNPMLPDLTTFEMKKDESYTLIGPQFVACTKKFVVKFMDPFTNKSHEYTNPFYVSLPFPQGADSFVAEEVAIHTPFSYTCAEDMCECQAIRTGVSGGFKGNAEVEGRKGHINMARQVVFIAKSEFSEEFIATLSQSETEYEQFANHIVVAYPKLLDINIKPAGEYGFKYHRTFYTKEQSLTTSVIDIYIPGNSTEEKFTISAKPSKQTQADGDEEGGYLFPKDKVYYINSNDGVLTESEAAKGKKATSANDVNGGGLSGGAIAGIVIAVIVVVAIIAFLIYWFVCRNGSKSDKSSSSGKKHDDADSGSGVNA